MKVYVYRFQYNNEDKYRFSNLPFELGQRSPLTCHYFSTLFNSDPEWKELCDFLIKHFNVPLETSFEIEL